MSVNNRERLFILLLVALGASRMIAFLDVAIRHIALNMDFDHCEGEVVTTLCEIKRGLSIYPDALSSRVGFIYMPLYYWVAGPLTACGTQLMYLGPRLVSLLSYLATVTLLPLSVDRYGSKDRMKYLGVVALVLLVTLSLFRRMGSFYFQARVDMLAMMFAVASWASLRTFGHARRGIMGAGVLQALAVVTKQSFVLQIPFTLAVTMERPWVSRENFHRAAWLIAPTVLLVAGILMDGGTNSFYYLFTVAGRQGVVQPMVAQFWRTELPRAALCEGVICLGVLIWLYRRGRRRDAFYLGAMLGAFGLNSFSTRIHSGGWDNCMIPVTFTLVSVAAHVLVHQSFDWLKMPKLTLDRRAWAMVGVAVVVALGLGRRSGLRKVRVEPTSIAYTDAFTRLAQAFTVYFTELPQLNTLTNHYDPSWPLQLLWYEFFRFDGARWPMVDPAHPPGPVAMMDRALAARTFDFIVIERLWPATPDRRYPGLVMAKVDTLCTNYRLAGWVKYPNEETMNSPLGGGFRPQFILARADLDSNALRRLNAEIPLRTVRARDTEETFSADCRTVAEQPRSH